MNIVIQASECPYCGTDIPTSAVKCSHCGEWLNERGDKGFLDWYFGYIYFCHYADFRGRLSRGHYWAGLAFCLVISGLLRVLDFWIIMVTLLPVTISSLFIGLMMLVRVLLPTCVGCTTKARRGSGCSSTSSRSLAAFGISS